MQQFIQHWSAFQVFTCSLLLKRLTGILTKTKPALTRVQKSVKTQVGKNPAWLTYAAALLVSVTDAAE